MGRHQAQADRNGLVLSGSCKAVVVTEADVGRARAGDAQAFGTVTEPYRSELLLHCYRLLGSLTDAEDVLQETLLAAWRAIDTFEGRASVRTWLYRIATNRALNARRAAGRRPPEPQPPFRPPPPTHHAEITWLQPCPDRLLEQVADQRPTPDARYSTREAVELAFVTGLQHLPGRQAAALILVDVLGYSTAEAAGLLNTGPTAVKGALQRARARMSRLARSGHDRCTTAGSEAEQRLSRRFTEAFTSDDLGGVLALLTDDAFLAMPPAPHLYSGKQAIGAFLGTSAGWRAGRPLTAVPTRANGAPAFALYISQEPGMPGHAAGIVVLTVVATADGHRISGVTRFLVSELFARFGLPEVHPGGSPS